MRLIELKPEWEHNNTYLTFQCPKCERDRVRPLKDGSGTYVQPDCWIMIPTKVTVDSPKPWGWNGETDFENVTITPSIWHHCESDPHFFIRDGEIQFA